MKDPTNDLRINAEKIKRENPDVFLPFKKTKIESDEDKESLLHELMVHKIELEMQNLELRSSQESLETAKSLYYNTFELAPVSYIIHTEEGIIVQANLASKILFNVDRGLMVGKKLSQFIFIEDQDIYYLHCKDLFDNCKSRDCKLRIKSKDGDVISVILNSITSQNEDGSKICRTIITNISRFQFE